MTTDSHEVYPNAPLAFVAVEVRFPGESGQGIAAVVQRAFRDVLGEDWVIEQLTQQELTFGVNLGGPANQSIRTVNVPRFTVRDRTSAVALTSNSVSIETTRYKGWADFRDLIERVLQATAELVEPTGVNRVGMRYVDEVRVDGVGDDLGGWSSWLPGEVLAPALKTIGSAGIHPVNWTGAAQYSLGDHKQLVFRYGPQQGYSVNPAGPLRRPDPPPPGPHFLLDFDSFWEPPTIPLFVVDDLLATCDTLRIPTRSLFDQMVTDRLVNEVFRKESR